MISPSKIERVDKVNATHVLPHSDGLESKWQSACLGIYDAKWQTFAREGGEEGQADLPKAKKGVGRPVCRSVGRQEGKWLYLWLQQQRRRQQPRVLSRCSP